MQSNVLNDLAEAKRRWTEKNPQKPQDEFNLRTEEPAINTAMQHANPAQPDEPTRVTNEPQLFSHLVAPIPAGIFLMEQAAVHCAKSQVKR
jgi:hypothetical protein